MNFEDFRLIPTISMTFEEKLFTIIKLFLFIGIISALLFNDIRYVLFALIILFLSIFLYYFYLNNKKETEEFLNINNLDVIDNKVCTKPTIENPFMNPTVVDFQSGEDKPSGCSIENEKINNEINNNFKKRIFKDVNDLYDKTISQRQFYTMPSTTIPNKQDELADWLYGKLSSCKENNGIQCYRNIS